MDHFNMIIMKRILSVLSFTMLTVPLFAHAGMFDRFLEQMVSYRAILVTILTVHILLCIGVKLLKNKLSRYKRALLKAVKHIRKKDIYDYVFLDFVFFCLWSVCLFTSKSNILIGRFGDINISANICCILFTQEMERETYFR